jgi:lysine 2,3-aminomutase
VALVVEPSVRLGDVVLLLLVGGEIDDLVGDDRPDREGPGLLLLELGRSCRRQRLARADGVEFTRDECRKLQETLDKFPLSVTPYYLSLIDTKDFRNDPVFLQSFPSPSELIIGAYDMADPLAEDSDSPVPGITHRYPDRVLMLVTTECASYCRYCTRSRIVGDPSANFSSQEHQAQLDYIRATPQIRDVLLSGGDPLTIPPRRLDALLGGLRAIPHVEIIRVGSRVPVFLPQRITDEF